MYAYEQLLGDFDYTASLTRFEHIYIHIYSFKSKPVQPFIGFKKKNVSTHCKTASLTLPSP